MLFKRNIKTLIKIVHMNQDLINCSYPIQLVVSHKLWKAPFDW